MRRHCTPLLQQLLTEAAQAPTCASLRTGVPQLRRYPLSGPRSEQGMRTQVMQTAITDGAGNGSQHRGQCNPQPLRAKGSDAGASHKFPHSLQPTPRPPPALSGGGTSRDPHRTRLVTQDSIYDLFYKNRTSKPKEGLESPCKAQRRPSRETAQICDHNT